MPELNETEKGIMARVLKSGAFQNLIGAEEWDLSEAEEMKLWDIIERIES